MKENIFKAGKWIAESGSVTDWLTAIGTISSVGLALYLSLRRPKVKGVLKISERFQYYINRDTNEVKLKEITNKNCKKHQLLIEFVNIGEIPIQIDEWITIFESGDGCLEDKVVWDLEKIESEFSECIVKPYTTYQIKLTDTHLNLSNIKQYPFMRMVCSDIYGNSYKSNKLDISAILIKLPDDFVLSKR